MPTLHDDEHEIDADLVRRLVAQSMPQFAQLPVEPLTASGSTNALFRLGDDLLARLPRQPGGSATIEKEARWLPVVAPALAVEVPEVVALGEPGFGYPERWSVTRWLEGEPPSMPYAGSAGQHLARDLAQLVTRLHGLDVPLEARGDPRLRSYRGGPLADLDEDFHASLEECRRIDGLGLDFDAAPAIWREALAAEREERPRTTWLHGDLLAENLLVRDGRLAAVLDFGGLALGDPSVDLVVAWEALDPEGRKTFRDATGFDDRTWAKGRGWALLIALITFPYYWDTMPDRCAARRAMAAAVLEEAPASRAR